MIDVIGVKISWKLFFLGIILTPVFTFIQKYIYNDWEFLNWVFILIILDTITGTWRAIRDKEMSSKGFSQIITKVLIYGIFLVVIHVLEYFTIKKTPNNLFGWLDSVAYSTLIIRESISIFENLAAIAPNIFPKKILEKLKNFDNDGNRKKPDSVLPETKLSE